MEQPTESVIITYPIEIPDDIKALVEDARRLDFDTISKRLEKEIDAVQTLTVNGFKFAFTSPVNQEYTIFYVHKPHGAQREKAWPGWRHNMFAAFERAGMVLR